MDVDKINLLAGWIDASADTVFFGGAGVSTESGIPDFRSGDGLYTAGGKAGGGRTGGQPGLRAATRLSSCYRTPCLSATPRRSLATTEAS